MCFRLGYDNSIFIVRGCRHQHRKPRTCGHSPKADGNNSRRPPFGAPLHYRDFKLEEGHCRDDKRCHSNGNIATQWAESGLASSPRVFGMDSVQLAVAKPHDQRPVDQV